MITALLAVLSIILGVIGVFAANGAEILAGFIGLLIACILQISIRRLGTE